MREPLQVNFQESAIIPAPVAQVWEWTVNPEHAPHIFSAVIDTWTTAGTPGEVGHQWIQHERLPSGKDTLIAQTLVEVVPLRRMVTTAFQDGNHLTLTVTMREATLAEQVPGVVGEKTWMGLELDGVTERPSLLVWWIRKAVIRNAIKVGRESFSRELKELTAFASRDGAVSPPVE